MKTETIYAYLWDHATREMALTYAMLARIDVHLTRLIWDDLPEEARLTVRVAIKAMLEANDMARALRQVSKSQSESSERGDQET